jgi:hypothetical protein
VLDERAEGAAADGRHDGGRIQCDTRTEHGCSLYQEEEEMRVT